MCKRTGRIGGIHTSDGMYHAIAKTHTMLRV
jgi:hypothetical protein